MSDAPARDAPLGDAGAVDRSGLRLRITLGVMVLLLVVAGVATARLWPGLGTATLARIGAAERRVGEAGLLVAIVLQSLVALCGVLPASAGALAAGAAYGIVGGFASAGIGTLLGAAGGFALARSLLRPLTQRLFGRRRGVRRFDEAVTRDGWRLVCLLRVSPVMPFAVTSYALGLTGLGWRAYLLGTLASLPALLGYVVLGALSRRAVAAGGASPLRLALLVLAIAGLALLVLRLGRIIRIALRLPDPP